MAKTGSGQVATFKLTYTSVEGMKTSDIPIHQRIADLYQALGLNPIGLGVDIGTEGFFSDLTISKQE